MEELAVRVMAAVFEVSNTLGCGFLEKVYEKALARELEMRGMRVRPQAAVSVEYKGEKVGDYFADLLVEEEVIVELKCVECLMGVHRAQALNYLRAMGKGVALVVNFQKPKVEWQKVVWKEERKTWLE